MRLIARHALLLAVLSATLALPARAQRYFAHSFDERDGLPAPRIYQTLQAPDGRIWSTSRRGMAVYDGFGWQVQQPLVPLGDHHYEWLDVDGAGRLIRVTPYLEVVRVDGDRITQTFVEDTTFSIRQGVTGLAAPQVGDTLPLALSSTHGLYLIGDTTWTRMSSEDGALPTDSVASVAWWGDRLVVATLQGLRLVDMATMSTRPFGTELGLDTALVSGLGIEYPVNPQQRSDDPKLLWCAGDGWLATWDGETWEMLIKNRNWLADSHDGLRTTVQPDYAGGAFIGHPTALFHFDARGNFSLINEDEGLQFEGATHLMMDREFNLWVSNARGVTRFSNMALRHFRQEHGMLENEVATLLWIAKDSLLVGHNNGYSFITPRGITPHAYPEKKTMAYHAQSRVLDATRTRNGRVFMAGNSLGVLELNEDGSYRKFPAPGASETMVNSLLPKGDGNLYAGTSNGLYLFDPVQGYKPFFGHHFMPPTYIRRVEWDGEGRLLAADLKRGLFRFEEDTVRLYTMGSMRVNEFSIFSMMPYEGRTLLGTHSGVLEIRGDSLAPWSELEERLSRPVYGMMEARDGTLWLGCDDGLRSWDGRVLRHLGVLHGLPSGETNREALSEDRYGRVWVGTARGLALYDPIYDQYERTPKPRVELVRSEELDSAEVRPGEPVRYTYPHNQLSFRVRTDSYINETGNRYQYYLEGSNAGWNEPRPIRGPELTFANLSPGRYRLHIRVANAFGQWSDVVSSRPVLIVSPFWSSPMFVVVIAIVLLGTGLLGIGLMLQRRYARKLEKDVRHKTRELRQHQDQLEKLVEDRTSELHRANVDLQAEVNMREEIQQDLSRHHQRLVSVFNGVHDGIVTVDNGGMITRANHAMAEMMGTERGLLHGQLLARLLPVDELIEEGFAGREIEDREVLLQDRTVGEKILRARVAPLQQDQDRVSEVMLVLRDVTRLYQLQREVAQRSSYRNIIGRSGPMQEVYRQLEDLSSTLSTVLITGESGTGKELVAAALHHASPRSEGPFVRVNCAALSETILESELFGHVKGAFTGAVRDRAGRFEAARRGTLFLDEIGDISAAMQAKLLRALETGEFERVGDSMTLTTDARIVSATNRDLRKRVEEGLFRKDLYYRLNVIQIHLPPLRERLEDIPLLVDHLSRQFREAGLKVSGELEEDTLHLLMRHDWPGNVRELRNVLERALILARGEPLKPSHLPDALRGRIRAGERAAEQQNGENGKSGRGTEETPAQERARILHALEQASWNVAQAARRLGIARNTVYTKMKLYDLKRPE